MEEYTNRAVKSISMATQKIWQERQKGEEQRNMGSGLLRFSRDLHLDIGPVIFK